MKEVKQVSIANDLIRSAQGLNLGEKRLLMLAISKLDSQAKPTFQGATTVIRVTEMVDAFGLNPDKAYQEAKKAAEGMMKRQIRLKPNDADSELIQWVGKSKYSKGEGWILIEFYHGLFPHLFELKSHFTTYKLSRASALRSVYSWRLFELLMQFKKTGLLNISLEEFRHTLEVPSSYETDFSWLRMRVIEPAVKEIREKDGLAIQWEAIKAGRKVKALTFTFPTEQPLMLNTNPKPLPKTAKRQTKSNLATHAVAKDSMAADLSERQQQAEASGLAQLEALAKQYGIELPKLKGKRTSSTAKG